MSNDPSLTRAAPTAGLSPTDPDTKRLAAEIARLDAAVARMTATLDFYAEPANYQAAQRRLG